MSEFDRTPVAPESLQSGRYFAASYAGEHEYTVCSRGDQASVVIKHPW